MDTRPQIRKKPIRSYVIRSGRMTGGQKAAYDQHWNRYGLDLSAGRISFPELFGRKAPVVLEIGFGMGDSLIDMCRADKERDYLGVEVHPPGVGRIMNNAERHEIQNLRVFLSDAKDVLSECIPDNSLERVQIYFPDPWHKRKHTKRRLVQPDFVRLISQKLSVGGVLHMATDWEEYAAQMLGVADQEKSLQNTQGDRGYAPRPTWRPETKFERRGEKLGHGVWDLLHEKVV